MNRKIAWAIMTACLLTAAVNLGSLGGLIDFEERRIRAITIITLIGTVAALGLPKQK
jgi:hypothetical protein